MCYYCGKPMSQNSVTRDHLQPRSKGGRNTKGNIVEACQNCNVEKGCLSLPEWRLVVAFRLGLVEPSTMPFPGEIGKKRAKRRLLRVDASH